MKIIWFEEVWEDYVYLAGFSRDIPLLWTLVTQEPPLYTTISLDKHGQLCKYKVRVQICINTIERDYLCFIHEQLNQH